MGYTFCLLQRQRVCLKNEIMKSCTSRECIVVCDIGATKTLAALYELQEDGLLALCAKQSYLTYNIADPYEQILQFVKQYKEPNARLYGVGVGYPGPVDEEELVQNANVPWSINRRMMTDRLSPRSYLLNDAAAFAMSLRFALDCDFYLLSSPKAKKRTTGNRGVLTVGSATGMSGTVTTDDGQEMFYSTEGGHGWFTPRNAVHIALWNHLRNEAPSEPVRWGRLLSGPGLVRIWNFFESNPKILTEFINQHHDSLLQRERPSIITNNILTAENQNKPEVISLYGLQGDLVCAATLALFAELIGMKLGELALSTWCTGGLYLAGGIPLKIRDMLDPFLMKAFLDTSTYYRSALINMPVQLVVNDEIVLRDLANYVLQHTRTSN